MQEYMSKDKMTLKLLQNTLESSIKRRHLLNTFCKNKKNSQACSKTSEILWILLTLRSQPIKL